MTPLRGLGEFTESERDVLFGRDRERDELAALLTSEGFRAGLLYGEPGVGKTSLLRAGVIPHLRDHGVIALLCNDISRPIDSFSNAITATTGLAPSDGERPINFLARVVSQSLAGQLYLFILDGVDALLARRDSAEQIVGELADLFQRVVTRSGGRARFLFCCASASIHLFGLLERRTGSLFPPTNRYELQRFQTTEASLVLERTLALAGVPAEPQLAHMIAETLSRDGPILPADVQIAALAVRELNLSTPDQVSRIGGATELERLWLTAAAASTGRERTALRLAAELATGAPGTAYPAEWAAARASIDPATAHHALSVLCDRGVVSAVPVSGGNHYRLAHQILAPRIREVAAPARAAARRAFELLGSKAQEGRRLSLREWRALSRERIVPSTPEEAAVVARTKRFYTIVAGAIAAAPILFLIIIYISMSGRYYLDVVGPDHQQRVVVRAGRPALSGFDWMPASPSFGSIVADTGFSRGMIADKSWTEIGDHDLAGDLDGDEFADQAYRALRPSLRSLIEYATTGSDTALDSLRKGVTGPDELAALLEALQPIARGTSAEVDVIEQALIDPAPAVRSAALGIAQAVARRKPDAYRETLAKQLAAPDAEQRRLAFSAVRALGDETAHQLFRAALAANPNAKARTELLGALAADVASAPSAAMAVSLLANRESNTSDAREARVALRRAFGAEPDKATRAAAKLAANPKAPADNRVLALQLMLEFAPAESYQDCLSDINVARRSKAEAVRAAALPVYAKFAPTEAVSHLAAMLDDKSLPNDLRVAMALAWGEIAKSGDAAAQGALEQLVKDRSSDVRAAAATAYGNVGRAAQEKLTKMVKQEGLKVAVGAAYGLANSADQKGSVGVATSGIAQLWKRKGRSRREAAAVFAKMARTHARYVYTYLASASRSKDDTGLHPIGVEGICAAMGAGYREAQAGIIRAARDDSAEVRRLVIQCVVDNPKVPKTATRVASMLVDDSDPTIRTEAARVLANIASEGKVSNQVAKDLVRLAADDDRDVRVVAVDALAKMGSDAPKEAAAALVKAFDRADEGEKLIVLKAARAIGASELVPIAITDRQPAIRIAAIDTAIATKTAIASSINTALTDDDPVVRRAALHRLAEQKDQLDQEAIAKALALATHDSDPAISDLAMATMARLVDPDTARERLTRALDSRSEADRARAAAACQGFVDRGDPKTAVDLLEPLLADPSHDVRAAMLPVLATAYAATNSPDQLAEMLRGSERHAMRRLVATAAFLALARSEAGHEAAPAALEAVAKKGGPMARRAAQLASGLIAGSADGIGFLIVLVP